MDRVSAFSVRAGNNAWTLSYDQASDTAFWNYGSLGSEEFVSVFFKFISMVADGVDTGAISELRGNPAAVLTLNCTDGISAELGLFPRNENSYFMRINGADTPYYINAVRLSGLLDRIADLEAGKSTKTPLVGETGGKT
jgi:hypothetical protein